VTLQSGAGLQHPRSHTAATDLKPAALARRVFFAVVGRGEVFLLLPFKAMLLSERARPQIWQPTAARSMAKRK
jgi:hypothetical protein